MTKKENKKRGAAGVEEKASNANQTMSLYPHELENVKQTLKSDGWKEINQGYYQSHRGIHPYNYISTFHRAVKTDKNTNCENDKLSCGRGCMTSGGEGKPAPALEKVRGQISFYGPIENNLTPKANATDTELSVSNSVSLGNIPSIYSRAAR